MKSLVVSVPPGQYNYNGINKTKNYTQILLLLLQSLLQLEAATKSNQNANKNAVVEDIVDIKELKKLFRTKNNVLVMYVSSVRESAVGIKAFREASVLIKGLGTMVLIDCAGRYVKAT